MVCPCAWSSSSSCRTERCPLGPSRHRKPWMDRVLRYDCSRWFSQERFLGREPSTWIGFSKRATSTRLSTTSSAGSRPGHGRAALALAPARTAAIILGLIIGAAGERQADERDPKRRAVRSSRA